MDIGTETVRCPWNKGKLVGQKLPLKAKEIWAVRFRLQLEHRTRDLALFCEPASNLDQISGRTGVEVGPCMTRAIPRESGGYITPEWSRVGACCWSRLDAG
jgi:hypothetical protein